MVPYGTVGWKCARARKELTLDGAISSSSPVSAEIYIAPRDFSSTLGIFISKDEEIKPPEVLCLFSDWGLCWIAANRVYRPRCHA